MSIEKPKSNSVITTELVETPADGQVIVFKVKDAGETKLPLLLLNEKLKQRAMVHGLVQKVSDAAALSRDSKTGKSASAQDKLAAMVKVVEHLTSGTEEWNLKREGGGGPGAETQLLVKALGELYPSKGFEALSKWVKARSVQERSALMAQENIKVKVDGYRSEQAKSVDAEELLAGLDVMDSEEDVKTEPEVPKA